MPPPPPSPPFALGSRKFGNLLCVLSSLLPSSSPPLSQGRALLDNRVSFSEKNKMAICVCVCVCVCFWRMETRRTDFGNLGSYHFKAFFVLHMYIVLHIPRKTFILKCVFSSLPFFLPANPCPFIPPPSSSSKAPPSFHPSLPKYKASSISPRFQFAKCFCSLLSLSLSLFLFLLSSCCKRRCYSQISTLFNNTVRFYLHAFF